MKLLKQSHHFRSLETQTIYIYIYLASENSKCYQMYDSALQ